MGILIILSALAIGGAVFLQQPQFGKSAEGYRLERMKNSSNYKDGKFNNLVDKPQFIGNANPLKLMKDFLFNKSDRSRPKAALPFEKVNIKDADINENFFVWFGHSSCYIQVDGKRILIDPVLYESASPVPGLNKGFEGCENYYPEDFPDIDYLLITHDHWDHLDYKTIIKLKPKIKKVITGLGVGAHLQHWGFDSSKVIENDWNDSAIKENDLEIIACPAHHFSGRSFSRDETLWLSFVIKTPNRKIFFSGDGGYGDHFKDIGDKYGPFDFAFLECGQYNERWKHIHMMPEETVQAAIDLNAKQFMPIHWAKFSLSLHAWDEPILRVTKEAKLKNANIIHPMIGQKTSFNDNSRNVEWWQGIE